MNKPVRLVYYGIVTIVMIISLYQIYLLKPLKVELGIYEGLILGVAAIAIWVIGALLHTLNTLKKSMPAIIGGGVLVAIFFISYMIVKPVPMDKFPDLSETINKMIGGGLITVYILGTAAIFIAIYSEIVALIKS